MSEPLTFTRRVEITTPLISLDDAKEHLTVTDDDHDSKINACVLEAQNIVLDYLQGGADATWTDATLPFPVRAAIYRWLTWLYDDSRGIDERDADAVKVHKAMELLLRRFTDPALA